MEKEEIVIKEGSFMKKFNKCLFAIMFCFVLCSALLLTGCQSYNDLENDCKGNWTFSNFYVLNNKTQVIICYNDLDESVSGSLNTIVKSIGEYYKNSKLNLDGHKNDGKISGTFIQNGQTTNISWWCPQNQLKILFDNFTLYSVQGTASNPTITKIGKATCLVEEYKLYLCYRTSVYSSYILYTR